MLYHHTCMIITKWRGDKNFRNIPSHICWWDLCSSNGSEMAFWCSYFLEVEGQRVGQPHHHSAQVFGRKRYAQMGPRHCQNIQYVSWVVLSWKSKSFLPQWDGSGWWTVPILSLPYWSLSVLSSILTCMWCRHAQKSHYLSLIYWTPTEHCMAQSMLQK